MAIQKGEKAVTDKLFYRMLKVFLALKVPVVGERFTNELLSRIEQHEELTDGIDSKPSALKSITFDAMPGTDRTTLMILSIISEDSSYATFESKVLSKQCLTTIRLINEIM